MHIDLNRLTQKHTQTRAFSYRLTQKYTNSHSLKHKSRDPFELVVLTRNHTILHARDSHRLTHAHIKSHRLTQTHPVSHRLMQTQIHTLTDSHNLTQTHIDLHKLTKTHTDSDRHADQQTHTLTHIEKRAPIGTCSPDSQRHRPLSTGVTQIRTHTHRLLQNHTNSHRLTQTYIDEHKLIQIHTGEHNLRLTHTEKHGPVGTSGPCLQSHCPLRAGLTQTHTNSLILTQTNTNSD